MKKNGDYPILAVLLVIVVLIEAIVFGQVLNIERHIRSVFLLLLYYPQSTVMVTLKIISVLQGNISRSNGDLGKRNAEFYESIFKLDAS